MQVKVITLTLTVAVASESQTRSVEIIIGTIEWALMPSHVATDRYLLNSAQTNLSINRVTVQQVKQQQCSCSFLWILQ